MELPTVAKLAHKVKLGPCRILKKARRVQIPRTKFGRGPKAHVRFDLEAVLKALQGDAVPGIGE